MSKKEYMDTYPSRYVCSVLDEIRKCHETRNYSCLMGLVEEVQTLANRMEAGLDDTKSYERNRVKLNELKTEYNKLVDDYNGIQGKIDGQKQRVEHVGE